MAFSILMGRQRIPAAAALAAAAAVLAAGGALAAPERSAPVRAVSAQIGQPAPRGPGAGFRAGAATSNITPPLGSSINGGFRDIRAEQVHDELHARCLVLDDGAARLAIAVVDSCMLAREVTDQAKKLVREELRLPESHILISATHSHSCGTAAAIFQSEPDPAYTSFLARRIADGIRRAAGNLAPAQIGWGAGDVPEEVFNRRWKMKPGSIPPNPFGGQDRVRMNPPRGDAGLIEPAGPTDPQVSVLSAVSLEGKPIALLANYSLHYVGGVGPGHLSADYYGMFAERMRELMSPVASDPPFVAMMSNGTSGDINNIDFRTQARPSPPYASMRRVAHRLAAEAYAAYRRIPHRSDVTLDAAQREISLRVRKPRPEEVERAREILAAAKGPVLTTPAEVYARETVKLLDYPDQVRLNLQTLRIGDLAVMAIPCEVFVDIGLELKRKSPLRPAFTVSLANGYNGYLPTPEHHRLGGYETWRARSSYLETEASPKIVQALLSLARELQRRGETMNRRAAVAAASGRGPQSERRWLTRLAIPGAEGEPLRLEGPFSPPPIASPRGPAEASPAGSF